MEDPVEDRLRASNRLESKMNVDELRKGLILYDKGVLKAGSHQEGSREFCALEFNSIMRGKKFSDAPTDMPDIRRLNDAFGYGKEADDVRTECLLPVMAALWDWTLWSKEKQKAFSTRLAIRTVNVLVAELPGLSTVHKEKCRQAKTLGAANDAAAHTAHAAAANDAAAYAAHTAHAAAAAAAYAAAYAAGAGADAAAYAAYADAAARAAGAVADAAAYAAFKVLRNACTLWVEAAESVEGMD